MVDLLAARCFDPSPLSGEPRSSVYEKGMPLVVQKQGHNG